MEAVSTLQTSDRRLKQTNPTKRISNPVGRRLLDLKPSNRAILGRGTRAGADILFTPVSADPCPLLFSDRNNPYEQPPVPWPPLPVLPSKPYNIKSLSYPPPRNNNNAKRPNNKFSTTPPTSPLTPKKSPPKPKHHQKREQKINPKEAAPSAASPVIGPDPGELPRGVFVLTEGNLHSGEQEAAGLGVEFSCPSMYSLAPPPSSLPLPRFALRPKLACNAKAAATGASINSIAPDSLRRILHLP